MLPYGSMICIRFKGSMPLHHLSPHWGTPSTNNLATTLLRGVDKVKR